MNTVTPSTLQAAIAAKQPVINLVPGVYPAEIRPNYDCQIIGSMGGQTVLTGGVSALGRIKLTVQGCTIREKPVACVDGLASCNIQFNRIEDIRGVAVQVTADGKQPSRTMVFRGNRVRRVDMGLMIGQGSGANIYDNWFDQCYDPTDPNNIQHGKALYLNDAATSLVSVYRNIFTRCLGTSARGLGHMADDCHFEDCGGTVALSANQGYASRLTLINSGGLDCNAAWATPCVLEDCRVFERRGRTDTAGIIVAGDSQYLSIVRPVIAGHAPGRSLIGNGGRIDESFGDYPNCRMSRYEIWGGRVDTSAVATYGPPLTTRKGEVVPRSTLYHANDSSVSSSADNGRTLLGYVIENWPDIAPTLDAAFEADGCEGRPLFSPDNWTVARAYVRGEL